MINAWSILALALKIDLTSYPFNDIPASIFSITAGEKEKKYPIKLYINLGSLIVSCTSQVGDAKEEVLVETEGKELEIGFNPRYLLDVLKNIEDDEVYMDFGSNISPCIVRPVIDDKFIYMVSPIRLKEWEFESSIILC